MAEPLRFVPPLPGGLERRSSLGSLADTLPDIAPGVRLDALPFPGVLLLRGRGTAFAEAVADVVDASLPMVVHSVVVGDGCEILCLGVDRWMMVVSSGREDVLLRSFQHAFTRRGGCVGTVVDLSDAYDVFHLYGPKAFDLLSKDCSFDLYPSAFPPGVCAETFVGGVPTLIQSLRGDDRVGDVVYRLYVAKSLSRFLVRLFCDVYGSF